MAGVSTESCVNGVPKKSYKEKTTPFEKWLTVVICLAVSVIIKCNRKDKLSKRCIIFGYKGIAHLINYGTGK